MRQHVFYEGDREQGIKYANEAIDLIAKTDREDTDHLKSCRNILNLV